MINNTIENITYYVKAAIKLPLNIVRWFCGRVVAIATNISNFLSNRSEQGNNSAVQQKSISDHTFSSADSQTYVSSADSQTYYEREKRETEFSVVFPFGRLKKALDIIHRDEFASDEKFTQEKTRLLKEAERHHLENKIDEFELIITTKTIAEGKKVFKCKMIPKNPS
ncbi:hypothetical protein [Salinisphaera sp. G21_0]|uniref:hypothetical protein n=1 Tax=Salinisphaera sp. G21_0 TaxID=2821094 RepID=UPI001ADB741D|nr:hypothetical protein [Salinisphaera sp. G21_0]MBO9480705.1 hypothetical protein [Salinisphaera sp. G21_0]